MKILHYSLGISPYRTGGLTKYSEDLIKEQAIDNEVFLLFPGAFSSLEKKAYIKSYKKKFNVKIYELKNPQAVSLLNGIIDVNEYTKKCNKKIFKDFLIENKIQILHIHSIMGLYLELLEVAKELKIKIIYTTHDYFGLAPNPNFLNYKGVIEVDRDLNSFSNCNIIPSSMFKIRILQSNIYREIKNLGGIKILKKIMKEKEKKEEVAYLKFKKEEFEVLKRYYDLIFSEVDLFLFNSSVTLEVFKKFLDLEKRSLVLNITHGDIKDLRKRKVFKDNLKVSYLGPYKKYKGFEYLLDIAKDLENENIEFSFYGDETFLQDRKKIKFKGKYNYSQLEKIFDETDVLVVPSIWKETFGFIVPEAISYGVPVLVSKNVGAKDILENKGLIIEDLKNQLLEISKNKNILEQLNDNIIKSDFDLDFQKHVKKILEIYAE